MGATLDKMFALVGRTTLLATRRQATVNAKRRMGSAAAPEWTGIDKVVRGYFPKDEQLVTAIVVDTLGFSCWSRLNQLSLEVHPLRRLPNLLRQAALGQFLV